MDPSCLVTTVQAGGGVMVWGMFSGDTLGPLVPIWHRLNATAWALFLTTFYGHHVPILWWLLPAG